MSDKELQRRKRKTDNAYYKYIEKAIEHEIPQSALQKYIDAYTQIQYELLVEETSGRQLDEITINELADAFNGLRDAYKKEVKGCDLMKKSKKN